MRYYVKVSEGEPVVVDVHDAPNGDLSVRVDGRDVEADVVPLGRQLSVRVDGSMVDLTTEGAPPEMGAVTRTCRAYIEVESERARAAQAVKRGGGGKTENVIRAPMPGRVVKVLVAALAQVTAGQTLVVMEAMKMENEIKARADGVVAEVHVAAGVTVEGNAKLLTFG